MCKAIDDMIKENMEIGRMEGRAEGEAHGKYQGEAGLIVRMYKNGFTAKQIASATDKMLEEVEAIIAGKEPVFTQV